MPALVEDAALKKTILKGLMVLDPSQPVFREPSPDGKLAAVFYDAIDVAQGHGYWRSRCAVVDDKNRHVRQFGFVYTITCDGVCAWSPDSKHLAVAISEGIVFWRKGKFACVRVLSWDDKGSLSWKDDKTLVAKNFHHVKVRRGGSDTGVGMLGAAEIRLDQVEFYQESQIGTIAFLLSRQPILTPELFSD
jgi:hypothetical protein